jgi:ubiquinone/menaquinone biosynthesis C-methylase UbiE
MAARRGVSVRVVEGRAEQLPFADGSFDAVLATFVWCSVADPARAFAEARRVLRPGGRLYLLEHVHNDWQPARSLQTLLAPAWRHVAGGCRLDQDTVGLLLAAGLRVERRADHLLGWVVELEARR